MSYKNLLISLLILGLSCPAIAKRLTFIDESGAALADVVVTAQENDERTQTSGTVAVMDQVNKQFEPHVLLINKGQQVAFPNSDNIRHHVYSFSQAKPFEIKLYSGDSEAPVTFDKSGVVVLGCNIHDSMVGYIYVNEEKQAWLTDTSGRLELPDDIRQIEVWHPHLNVIKTKKESIAISHGDSPQTVTLTLQAVPKASDQSNTFGKRSFGG